MVDATNRPQIVEHVNKALTQTVYETKWVPCSARFVVLGSPPRQTGLLQIYNLVRGDIELTAEVERPKSFKCGTFGASTLVERQFATGDFAGTLEIWDLERLSQPIFGTKAHETIINCIDGCGGLKGAGAPEIATGGRDGCVHVWDPRQRERPVASMEPDPGAPARDCWAVAFGDAHTANDRVVAAGYDNGDVKLLDLTAGKIRWETNVNNGVCGLEVRGDRAGRLWGGPRGAHPPTPPTPRHATRPTPQRPSAAAAESALLLPPPPPVPRHSLTGRTSR